MGSFVKRNDKKMAFNFGENWKTYSRKYLSEERLLEAKDSLEELFGEENIRGKSFFDIGCGSGIFSIAASQLGAKEVIGIDINPDSIEISDENIKKFSHLIKGGVTPKFYMVSVLSGHALLASTYDVVYAWGSLHHTGEMWRAIQISASLISKNGIFSIAIYNRHFTSFFWKMLKYIYNKMPAMGKRCMYYIFMPIIFMAKLIVMRKNPFDQGRGMNFFVDIVDWLGGYPYEYASIKEVEDFVTDLGFRTEKIVPTIGRTGCNQFVFRKL